MKTKTLIAGIIGGAIAFFIGWALYGIVFSSIMEAHTNVSIFKKDEEMIFWAMIASNLFWGWAIAIILDWAHCKSFGDGMIKGAFLGLFIGLSFDLGIYGMANWFNDLTGVGLDILLNIIMNALVGGVIGWYYSRTKA